MISKKLTAALVAVGVVASTSAIFNEINIKGAFADTVKQNVLYTKEDTTTVSEDDGTLTGAEEEAYKEKSLDILKKCFNISVEENENFKFQASIINEKTLDAQKAKQEKAAQDSYDKKEISKELYDFNISCIEKSTSDSKEMVKKLKHGSINAGWADTADFNKTYVLDFNENTKEIEMAMIVEGDHKETDTPLKISEDQLKNTAEDFIKQNKIGGIDKPKFMAYKDYDIFYKDENDPSKIAHIEFDEFTGKIKEFAVNTTAEDEYNELINQK